LIVKGRSVQDGGDRKEERMSGSRARLSATEEESEAETAASWQSDPFGPTTDDVPKIEQPVQKSRRSEDRPIFKSKPLKKKPLLKHKEDGPELRVPQARPHRPWTDQSYPLMNGWETLRRYTGRGVTVGVIGNSFGRSYAPADVAAGLLPGPGNPNGYTQSVLVFNDPPNYAPSRNEGRAMLQIIHNMAPEARLCFGGGGTTNMPSILAALIREPCNADIIIDDLANTEVNPYIYSDDTQAVEDAGKQGVLFFTAAGNHFMHDREFPVDLVPSSDPSVPAVLKRITDIPEWNKYPSGMFPQGNGFLQGFRVPSAGELKVFWNQFRASDDLDLYFIDRDMENVVFSSNSMNIRTGNPLEQIRVSVFRGFVAIGRRSTIVRPNVVVPPLRIWAIFYYNRDLAFGNTLGQYARLVDGRRAARNAITVAAFNYSDTSEPSKYSNVGPGLLYYDKEGKLLNGIQGETRLKPVVGGIDCTDHTFFSSGIDQENNGLPQFCGTSASVTFVGGFAALYRQAFPNLSFEKLVEAYRETGDPWDYRAGYGLTNADAVLYYLLAVPPRGARPTNSRTPSRKLLKRTPTPLRKIPTPLKKTTSLIKRTPTPLKTRTTRLRTTRPSLKPSPKVLRTPTRQRLTLRKASPTIRKAVTLRKASPTLRKAQPSLRKASLTLRKAVTLRKASPTLRKALPTLRKASPTVRKAVTLRKASLTLRKASSPTRRRYTPRRTLTPLKKFITPSKRPTAGYIIPDIVTRTLSFKTPDILTIQCDDRNPTLGTIIALAFVSYASECSPPANSTLADLRLRQVLINKPSPVVVGAGWGWFNYPQDPCRRVAKTVKFVIRCRMRNQARAAAPSPRIGNTWSSTNQSLNMFDSNGPLAMGPPVSPASIVTGVSIGAGVALISALVIGAVVFHRRQALKCRVTPLRDDPLMDTSEDFDTWPPHTQRRARQLQQGGGFLRK